MTEPSYYDFDGRPVTLLKLCQDTPEWAASRIMQMTAEAAALRAESERWVARVKELERRLSAIAEIAWWGKNP